MAWFILASLTCTLIVDSRLLLCSPEYDLSWHGPRGIGGLVIEMVGNYFIISLFHKWKRLDLHALSRIATNIFIIL
jgi:hypothetical protein